MQTKILDDQPHSFELNVVVEPGEATEEIKRAAIVTAYKRKMTPDPKRLPVDVVREELGEEEASFVFDEEVMNRCASLALSDVERDIVGRPQFSCSEHVSEGKSFEFRMKCVKIPDVELSSYDPVEITVGRPDVKEIEVDEQIDALKRSSAVQVTDTSHNYVVKGDTVELSLSTVRNGQCVKSLTSDKRMYHTGTLSMPDEFDDAICGMKVGETKTFSFEGPTFELDNDGNPVMELFTTTLTILRILTPEEPDVNDSWAQRVMPGCTGIDDMRKNIRAKLEEQHQTEYEKQVESLARAELSKRLVEKIPDQVYDAAISEAKQMFNDQLAEQNMTLEEYLKKENIEEQQVSVALMTQARSQLFEQLALNAYARHNSLELEETDLNNFFETISPNNAKAARSDFERDGRMCAARNAALRLKAAKHLAEHAIICDAGVRQ